jgi:uncharacterized protein YndB with AHSA1/START domain
VRGDGVAMRAAMRFDPWLASMISPMPRPPLSGDLLIRPRAYASRVPRYAAERTLLAPVEDVWTFLAEPYHLPDWWPGVSGVQPDRRGLAPGARWRVLGPDRPSFLKKPDASGVLLVVEVVPMQRIAFQLTPQRLDALIELSPAPENETKVELYVEAPFMLVRRAFPHQALQRLYELVQTAADS